MNIDQVLKIEELRSRCLEHSRRAFRLLPPLEKRIHAYLEANRDAADSPKLAEHESMVATIKSDPDRTDCGIYLLRKRASPERTSGSADSVFRV